MTTTQGGIFKLVRLSTSLSLVANPRQMILLVSLLVMRMDGGLHTMIQRPTLTTSTCNRIAISASTSLTSDSVCLTSSMTSSTCKVLASSKFQRTLLLHQTSLVWDFLCRFGVSSLTCSSNSIGQLSRHALLLTVVCAFLIIFAAATHQPHCSNTPSKSHGRAATQRISLLARLHLKIRITISVSSGLPILIQPSLNLATSY